MPWNFDNERPIYMQIMEKIKILIISENYKPGEKLPSVRDLASEASVNPNTMQKALQELEKEQLVYSQRTTGRFITENIQIIKKVRDSIAEENINNFFNSMESIGLNKKEAVDLALKSVKKGEDNGN